MTFNSFEAIHSLVRSILANNGGFDWSLQGFGMLRTYINDSLRLHVWDADFSNEGVSEMHTHPWHFHSLVVAGEVHNMRYRYPSDAEIDIGEYVEFNRQTILCGPGGGLVDMEPDVVKLVQDPVEVVGPSTVYTQQADEIHVSRPLQGTVTLVKREFLSDADHAYVFWPLDQEWVTAEPREATAKEVETICGNALERWFR